MRYCFVFALFRALFISMPLALYCYFVHSWNAWEPSVCKDWRYRCAICGRYWGDEVPDFW